MFFKHFFLELCLASEKKVFFFHTTVIGFLALLLEAQNWIEFLALHLLYPKENTISVITSFLHAVDIILMLDIVYGCTGYKVIPVERPTHYPACSPLGVHPYTLRKLCCGGGSHFLGYSIESILLPVNVHILS